MQDQKSYYQENKSFLRKFEATKEFHYFRNARILLKKLILQLSKDKITSDSYSTIEQTFILSKILPLLRQTANNKKKSLTIVKNGFCKGDLFQNGVYLYYSDKKLSNLNGLVLY